MTSSAVWVRVKLWQSKAGVKVKVGVRVSVGLSERSLTMVSVRVTVLVRVMARPKTIRR